MLTIMILVTSGLGFIGSHVTGALLDAGQEVLATSHTDRPAPSDLVGRARLRIAQLDVLDTRDWAALAAQYSIGSIVHLAATHDPAHPVETVAADVRGFANLLGFASQAGVHRVLYASSIGVYAATEPPYREDALLPPVAPHMVAAAKKTLELVADLARQDGDLEVCGLRIGGAWGPRGNTASRFIGLPRLVRAAVEETPLQLDVDIACDLIHVDDVAQAVLALITADSLTHPRYNVGSGRIISDREVVDAILQLIPGAPVSVSDSAPRYDVGPLDVTTIAEDTGFHARVDLHEGLQQYADWLRATAHR